MAKFKFAENLSLAETQTSRVADGTGASNQLDKADNGKFVKLKADSQYGLCAVGDKIEGVLSVANDIAPADGYNLGAIQNAPRTRVTCLCDGSQAAGTGSIAVGDFVVCGTIDARGTALTTSGPKVRKATNQPGATITAPDNLVASVNAAIALAVDQALVAKHGWRVVSLGNAGAVGDTCVIEKV